MVFGDKDAWVWDVYRATRFVQCNVRVLTFKDVNVEELTKTGTRNAGLMRNLARFQQIQAVGPGCLHPDFFLSEDGFYEARHPAPRGVLT